MIESTNTINKLARKIQVQKSGVDVMAGSMFQMELIECFFKADLPNMQTRKASSQIRIKGRMQ